MNANMRVTIRHLTNAFILLLLLLTMSRYKDRVAEAGRLQQNLFSRPAHSDCVSVDRRAAAVCHQHQ